MLLTLYPNNELRARVCAPPLSRRRQGGARRWKPSPLNLSIVENLRRDFPEAFNPPVEPSIDRPGYGGLPTLRAFSLRARRTIVRAGALIGRGESRLSTLFLTGTLPGGTEAALEAISRYSSWIVHEIMTVLPRLAGLKPSDLRVIWVWEWQKRGALHWHGIVEAPTRDRAKLIFDGFKSLWIRILESVGRRLKIDIAERAEGGTHACDHDLWRTRAEWARKNPSRYLAKYLGKLKTGTEIAQRFPPCRWYQVSRRLLLEAREETVSVSTATSRGGVDHEVNPEVDLPLLEKLFGLSHKSTHFPDKVRAGYTFVFYVNDENRKIVEELMQEFGRGEAKNFIKYGSRKKPTYYGLQRLGSYPDLIERFVNDLGSYYRGLYSDWVAGLEVPEEELFWLDHYAHRILHVAGLGYQVKAPEEAKRALTSQNGPKLEVGEGLDAEVEQTSFYP